MEQKHLKQIQSAHRDAMDELACVVLDIPDDYRFMDEDLIAEGRIVTREGFFVGYEARGGTLQPFIGWQPADLQRPLTPDGFYEIRERFELAREALFSN